MITIYGIRGGHVARLRAALLMKNLEFEHVSVNMANRGEEFLQKSLAETIPFMEDGDITVSESIAATEYLDEKYPDTYKMMGTSLREKVTILNVIWAIDRIGHYFVPLYIEKFGMAEKMRANGKAHRAFIYDDQQKTDFQKELTYRLEKLAALKQNKFFTSQFSSADASMLAMLGTISWLGLEIGDSWKTWMQELMQEEKIAKMNAPEDEKGVREI